MIETVDRRSKLSLEEFQNEYAIPGLPVIITDASEGWPARDWTPESLAALVPDAKIEAMPTASSCLKEKVRMTLSEYVEYLRSPDERKLYMINWVFAEDRPELLADFEVPIYFRDDWFQEMDEPPPLLWIFLGPPNSGLFMHVDVGHTPAWNVQLTGTKAWKLWSPEQENLLYEGEVNAFDPDLEKFPRFARAKAVDTEVRPGECMYVPPLWWHQTKNIDAGLALTANYVDQFSYKTVLSNLRTTPDFRPIYRSLRKISKAKTKAVEA